MIKPTTKPARKRGASHGENPMDDEESKRLGRQLLDDVRNALLQRNATRGAYLAVDELLRSLLRAGLLLRGQRAPLDLNRLREAEDDLQKTISTPSTLQTLKAWSLQQWIQNLGSMNGSSKIK